MRRKIFSLLCSTVIAASFCLYALPLAAQDEEIVVPFEQLVTSDGAITMAYPGAWAIDDASQPGTLIFSSPDADAESGEGVIVSVSFLTDAGLAEASLSGTTAEMAAQLRAAYLDLFVDADGQPTADIGEPVVFPAADLLGLPEIASVSVNAEEILGTFFLWQITDGLYGTAWSFSSREAWLAEQPTVLEIVRSVRFIGDAAMLAEGGN